MVDSVFEGATKKLSALLVEVREMENFLSVYRKLEIEFVQPKTVDVEQIKQRISFALSERITSRKTGKAEILATAALAEIEHAQRPLPLGDLTDRLIKLGVEIGGADPRANLSAHLNNSGVLVSIRGHGWWPKNEPYEAANYDPSAPQTNEAIDPATSVDGSMASDREPNDAERRGEVALEKMTP